jgi:ferredoxin-NADP reductase/ferredoxin
MRLAIQCTDNETLLLNITPEETLYDAAKRQGINWPIDCAEGVCGTCKCRIISGSVAPGFYTDDALTQEEAEAGYALGCQAKAQTDLVLALRMPVAQLRRNKVAPTLPGRIERIDPVAQNTVHLTLTLNEAIDFLPGQYAKLKTPGTDVWRSYSFTSIPARNELSFLIRLLPAGAMSDYLRNAQVGDTLEMTAPHGIFFMRPNAGQSVLIAGGTGLGPMLSMLQTAADNASNTARPMQLLYGVNDVAELACLDMLDAVKQKLTNFSWSISVASEDSSYRRGFATDLLDDFKTDVDATTFYLCGPPPMIETGRAKLNAMGVSEDKIVFEKFIPSS